MTPHTPLAPASPAQSPDGRQDRVIALDVLRGLAVFGILVVNVEQMFLPLFIAESPVAMIPGERGTWVAWAVTDALFTNKFLTIFSLLFGAGFCLQWTRTHESPQNFRRLYLRRVFGLMLFGLIHALFFYKADVLVIYGLTALGLFALKGLSARRLLQVGGSLLLATVVWYGFISGPGKKDAELPERQRAIVEEIARMRLEGTIRLEARDFAPLKQLNLTDDIRRDASALLGGAEVLEDGRIRLQESEYPLPMPEWLAILLFNDSGGEEEAKVEYAVYSEGPVRAAIFGRFLHLLALLLLYTPFYLGWRTLALFLIGAGCVKLGLLDDPKRPVWRRTAALGVGLGLPLSLVATALRGMAYTSPGTITTVSSVLQEISCLLLAPGIAAIVFLGCSGGLHNRLQRSLAAVGKTALTNYIGQ